MVKTDLHRACGYGGNPADPAAVERLLKQHPEWVHEKDSVRSARVWDGPLRAAVLREAGVLR